ncbi:MAG: ADP-ribosylation factor-like protein [Methanoregula sp.]|nr:ADP-ribosylation factor-like protein [Methanoregula sp.]
MISTGMNGVDDLLGGGIREGSRVLFSMEPGVDGQLFMVSALFDAQRQGRSCLVVIPHTTVDAFLHDTERLKCGPLNITDKKIVFLDSVDRERMQQSYGKGMSVEREWNARISRICAENHIDVIFGYFDVICEDFGVENGLAFLSPETCGKKPTLIIEHLNLEGSPLLDSFIQQYSFDLVIAIRASFRPLPHFNYFTIEHVSWLSQPRRSIPFIVKDGRIVPYIPKIVVAGPPGSGKSSFVAVATQEGQSIDRSGLHGEITTVGMDFGWLHWKDFDITLYGTPGQPRFDPMLPAILRNAVGIVLLVDGTKPDQFSRGKHLFTLLKKKGVPLVVAINKRDQPGIITEEDIRKELGIGKEIPVFVISALEKNDVRRVVEYLVDSITQYVY